MPLTTRFVSEREFVFSPHALGFPSIQGCHAVVYVNDAGLFGFHSVGGETSTQYTQRATDFATFIKGHPSGRARGAALYGAAFITAKQSPRAGNHTVRGYGGDKKVEWIAELNAFATAIKTAGLGDLTGKIYGCDLGNTPALANPVIGSAYVEYTRVAGKCVIQVKPWNDGDAQKGAVTDHVNIQYNPRGGSIVNQTSNTIINVNAAGVKTAYPETLR